MSVPSAPKSPRARLRRRLRHSLGIVDVGISSLGNLALSVVAARSLPLTEFGAFATCLLAGLVCVGISKALFGDVFLLTFPTVDPSKMRQAARRSVGSAAVTFVAAAPLVFLVLLTVLLMAQADVWIAVTMSVTVALVTPLLSVQDLARSFAYGYGESEAAVVNSCVWTLGVMASLSLLVVGKVTISGWLLIAVWGFSAALGGVVCLRVLRVPFRMQDPRPWISRHRSLTKRLGLDYGLMQASAEASGILVAALAGVDQAGLLRKAQIPLAPVVIVTNGITAVLQPALLRRLSDPNQKRPAVALLAYRIGSSAAACAILLGLGLVAVPEGVVEILVGKEWAEARTLVPLLSIYLALGALAACQGVTLRAFGALNAQVKLRLALVPVSLLVLIIGAKTGGAMGAAVALCVGLALTTGAWAVLLRRSVAESTTPGEGTV